MGNTEQDLRNKTLSVGQIREASAWNRFIICILHTWTLFWTIFFSIGVFSINILFMLYNIFKFTFIKFLLNTLAALYRVHHSYSIWLSILINKPERNSWTYSLWDMFEKFHSRTIFNAKNLMLTQMPWKYSLFLHNGKWRQTVEKPHDKILQVNDS